MAQVATADQNGGHQTQQADNRHTRRIAQFVSGLTYDKTPPKYASASNYSSWIR